MAEYITDTKPELIGSPGDDKLLRKFDDTSLGTPPSKEGETRRCIEYVGPMLLAITTAEGQKFIKKEHITVPYGPDVQDRMAYSCHLTFVGDN